MQKTPYKPVADELAKYGRYGDSMLVHMNPVEVAGLASLSPTGSLTINPQTGQPEAFLPFLAPLLGSVLGTSFLPGLASAAGLGGLGAALAASPALAGAIGSGIATTLESGSLEKGLVSGLTGFGLGKALGAAGELATGAEPIAALGGATDPGAAAVAEMATSMGVEATAPSLTEALRAGTSNLGQMISDPGAIGSALMKPGTLIPAGIGVNQMETERLQEELKNRDIARRQAREAEYARAQSQMEAAMYPNLQYPDIPGMSRYGMGGGIVDMLPSKRMQEGGQTEADFSLSPGQLAQIQQFRDRLMGTGVFGYDPVGAAQTAAAAGTTQAPAAATPPEGYRPGIDPEFLYNFSGAPQAGRFGGTVVGTGANAVEQFTVPGLTGVFGNLNPGGDPFIPGITTAYGTNLMADPLVGSGTTRKEIVDEITSGSFGRTGDRGMRTGIEGDRFGNPINAEMAYRVGAPEEAVRRLVEQEDARRKAGQQGYAPADRVVAPPTEEQQAEFLARQAAVQAGDTAQFLDPEVRDRMDAAEKAKAGLGAFLRGEVAAETAAPPAVTEPVAPPAVIEPVAPRFTGGSPTFQETTNIAYDPISGISTGGIGNIAVEPGLASGVRSVARPVVQPAVEPAAPQLTEEQLQAIKERVLSSRGRGSSLGFNVAPMVRLQEGGMTEGMDQELVQMTVAAIRGELPDGADEVISRFIELYGNDEFIRLREQVLQEVVPGAQTQGMIRGQGGGMDDEVMGMIGSSQPVAVSPGEYIVPADAVSGLGDGSSDAGAARLDELVENVRKARTGTAKQPAPIKESMGGKV